jgi:acetate kinase
VRVLVVNTGSSSLKLSVLDGEETVTADTVERWEGGEDLDPLRDFLERAGDLDAVGHRVVHGGPRFQEAVRLDDDAVGYLDSIADLAPLHNPRAVAAIRAVGTLVPDLPAVAAFDTAFHATMPDRAATYALPREWNQRYGLRRYGFHGLSHAHAVRRAAELVDRPLAELRLVSCHLGAGASLCAVRDGRSVDTTMGFTPLDGLVMATRSGAVDPGLVLWLETHAQIPPSELEAALEYRSGLYGLAGTADMREILARATAGDARAELARDTYLHRLRASAAAMAAAMDGLDAIVFTGGVGENSAEIRQRAMSGLGFLGIAGDPAANADGDGDRDISAPGATVRALVIGAREDIEIARQVRAVLAEAR